MLVALVVGVAIGVYWNRTWPPMHQSTIELYLSEPFRTTEEAESMTLRPANGLVRLYHDATGDLIVERISRQYDLPSRYGLHADIPDRERIALQILKSRIQAYTTQFESLRLTVQDYDRHTASAIARLMHLELKAELEQRAMRQLSRTAAMYEQIGSEWTVEAERERSAVADLLEAGGAVGKGLDAERELLRLNLLASQAQAALSERSRMRSNLWRMQALASHKQLPELMLVHEATLDQGPSLKAVAFGRVAFMVLACICAMLTMSALIRVHRTDIVEVIEMLSTGPGQPVLGTANGISATNGAMAEERELVDRDQPS